MAFTQKRGRPKQNTPITDYGTPELRAKRSAGLTSEPLDLCLEKRLISSHQHWCGVHLRWLYTLRYGAPSIIAKPYHLHAHMRTRTEDPQWRSAREQEYKEAIHALRVANYYESVLRLCVFHDLPIFLNHRLLYEATKNTTVASRVNDSYQCVIGGLSLLSTLWRS